MNNTLNVRDLQPAETQSVRQFLGQHGWGHWAVNAYRTVVDDLIAYDASISAPANVQEARIRGVELVLGSQLFGWDWNANYSLLEPENRSAGANRGNELARRAKQLFNLDLDRRLGAFSVGASLHAEELPGMLAAYHLRPLLEAADAQSHIHGEVVLVPMANPVGAAQRLQHKPMGRFEFNTGENFNRHYPDFFSRICTEVLPALGPDAASNVVRVRQAMRRYLDQWTPATELASLRRQLLLLAHDADYVLDLHCDCEAVLHFYCEESCWPQLAPLAHYLHSHAILLAKNSGSSPFDESMSSVWWRLAEALAASGSKAPLPQACLSTTIELRGEAQVEHALAAQDAQGGDDFGFLRHRSGGRGGWISRRRSNRHIPLPRQGQPCAADRVAFAVEQLVDPGQERNILCPVVATPTSAGERFEHRELLFPIAQHVLLEPERLGDLTNGAERAGLLAIIEGGGLYGHAVRRISCWQLSGP
jgi:predicted deacylase